MFYKKKQTKTPVLVGFGIKSRKDTLAISNKTKADGIIIGSALIKKYFEENMNLKKYLVALSKFIKQDHDIICCNPSWLIFDHFAELNNLNVIKSDLKIQNNKFSVNFDDILLKITSLTRIIYLIMPIEESELNKFLIKIPDGIVIILDFCYYDFLDISFKIKQIIDNKQVICLFSFSKFHALANLQLGYVITNQVIINLLKLCQISQVPTFKEEIALIALNDKSHNNKVKDYYSNEKTKIFNILKNHEIEYIDSFQNFIYIKFNKQESLKNELKKYDINYDFLKY